MYIPQVYSFKAGCFCPLFASQGMTAGCGWEVPEVEMGIKSQETVRDLGV